MPVQSVGYVILDPAHRTGPFHFSPAQTASPQYGLPSGLPFPTKYAAFEAIKNYGFPPTYGVEEIMLPVDYAYPDYAVANYIDWQLGDHCVVVGDVQTWKTENSLYMIDRAINKEDRPIIYLTQNANVALNQFQLRVQQHNEKREAAGQTTLPLPADLLRQSDYELKTLLKSSSLIVGLANEGTFKKLNAFFAAHPDLKQRAILIHDEADLYTFELKCGRSGGEDELLLLQQNQCLYAMVSVTATPQSIFLADGCTKIYILPHPPNYIGIDKVKHVAIPEREGKYDPIGDAFYMDQFMRDVFRQEISTALITASRRRLGHKEIISHLSGIRRRSMVYMEMNEQSVKVYDQDGIQISGPDGSIFTLLKSKNRRIADIGKAFDIWKGRVNHIIVVAGNLASRGISFVDKDYERRLTHQYLPVLSPKNASSNLENNYQLMRCLGVGATIPTLYTPSSVMNAIKNVRAHLPVWQNQILKSRQSKTDIDPLRLPHTGYSYTSRRKQNGSPYEAPSLRDTVSFTFYVDKLLKSGDPLLLGLVQKLTTETRKYVDANTYRMNNQLPFSKTVLPKIFTPALIDRLSTVAGIRLAYEDDQARSLKGVVRLAGGYSLRHAVSYDDAGTPGQKTVQRGRGKEGECPISLVWGFNDTKLYNGQTADYHYDQGSPDGPWKNPKNLAIRKIVVPIAVDQKGFKGMSEWVRRSEPLSPQVIAKLNAILSI